MGAPNRPSVRTAPYVPPLAPLWRAQTLGECHLPGYMRGIIPQSPRHPRRGHRQPKDRGASPYRGLQGLQSWNIVTRIQVEDFAQALGAAVGLIGILHIWTAGGNLCGRNAYPCASSAHASCWGPATSAPGRDVIETDELTVDIRKHLGCRGKSADMHVRWGIYLDIVIRDPFLSR